VSTVYRVVGAPGCGKTRFLSDQVERWVERDGIDPEQIVLCSFTRTAASVLRGRVAVPAHNASTLHALAYRAIGHRPIAEVGELAKEWNSQQIPDSWRLGSDRADLEEGVNEDADRGTMLAAYSLMRGTLGNHPQYAALREQTKHFAARWEDFKGQTDSIDFQDMIDLALLDADTCPGTPACFVVDEAQDLQPAQWLLAQKWGEAADRFLVAGDPAQVLYSWIGARPDELLTELPSDHHRMLGRSHRLPRSVQTLAERWLSQHSGAMMQGRSYAPTDREGRALNREYTWRNPDSLVTDLEEALAEPGKTAMVLATCSYLLGPTISLLRDEGIPFHNPYRRTNGAWNPLRPPAEGKVSTQQRLRVYLEPEWTGPRATTWLEMLPAEWFVGTKKAALERIGQRERFGWHDVTATLKEQAWEPVGARDVRWLSRVAAKAYQRPLDLLAAIVERHGGITDDEPRVVVGTVHSVKGGEADTVILYPDLPRAAVIAAGESAEGRDAVVRQAYVGMTRARDTLIFYAADRDQASIWGV
jgi:DNA helicase-2/ATP-dependent DNA helicase PcrA